MNILSNMQLKERIETLIKLGGFLASDFGKEEFEGILYSIKAQNGWFTPEQCRYTMDQIIRHFLQADQLWTWVTQYPSLKTDYPPQKVGLVLAGNIPAVGWHDVLCTFVAGHKALIKYSEKDKIFIPFLLKSLVKLEPRVASYFQTVERLTDFDKVIATGSDNAARYFEHYFGTVPNIIRHNRNSVAVLNGQETTEDIALLAEDIFRYYGLGCRSVSKLYVPKDFKFEQFMEALDMFSEVAQHSKYRNNFDYNRSLLLLNGTFHWVNDGLALVESSSLLSRIATLHYEFYESEQDLKEKLDHQVDNLQCIVSKMNLSEIDTVDLGESQHPNLSDYADHIDTLAFLVNRT